MSKGVTGQSIPRVDGMEKATGVTRYLADMTPTNAWYGGVVRSPVARGRIRTIRFAPGFDWSRVVVLTSADLPGPNQVAMVRNDLPILAEEEVRFATQPVVLLAAPSKALLQQAREAVTLEIDEEEPVLSLDDALAGRGPVYGEDNIIAAYDIRRGDLEEGFAQADRIIEETYRTGYQEQLYLEPQGVVAAPKPRGVEVVGSMQCPYYVKNALVRGLALPEDAVTVRQAPTGGGFGGKEDYPSVLALQAALLALKAERPVRLLLDREEDILCTPKRHPSQIRVRTGVRNDGTLTALEMDAVLDGGAYTTLSVVVLQRTVLHGPGAYPVPNARVLGRVAATNTPPNGGFRGFGAPQGIFAMERHMDRIAGELQMDPAELRLKNCFKNGDRFHYGQQLEDGANAGAVLRAAMEESDYLRKREEYARETGNRRQGIGISLSLHGGGFTGSGEVAIDGHARVRATGAGQVELRVAGCEIGQGASTVLVQRAADTLGLPCTAVRHPAPDTDEAPDSGPTVASRTTAFVGTMVERACQDLLAHLREALGSWYGLEPQQITLEDGRIHGPKDILCSFAEAVRRHLYERGPLEGFGGRDPSQTNRWDEESFRGEAYRNYSWAAHVVEVETHRDTLEIRPTRATLAVDAGEIVNPILARGQVEGGALQAYGYGYLEHLDIEGGRYRDGHLTTYQIPTALEAPDFSVLFLETGEETEPKGLGELPMDGGAPAIVAAAGQALGIFGTSAPLTAEEIALLLQAKEGDRHAP
ncbi:MAG: xanthine dehydrogenase family protein molybdopterin-binding subunit [Synergistales bacterium]|nr:xanthine dehydrogenase family protein molybdopterin-binding subunit [Synergistales bacterium]